MSRRSDAIPLALLFAARFGFITRELFFEYLCHSKRTQKFQNWNRLKAHGLIKQSRNFEKIYYLTKTGRRNAPTSSVPARSVFFVEHDITVVKLLLEIAKSGLVMRSWTEFELTKNPWESYSILGCDRIEKLPDLVLDLKSADGFLRIAFEVERSQKSDARYDQVALSYLNLKNINLVLLICSNRANGNAILRAFNSDIFLKNGKVPGIILSENFEKHRLSAETLFMGRKLELKKFILAATKLPETKWNARIADNRTAVRLCFSEEKASP